MNLKNQSNTSFFLKKKYLRYIVALLTLTCILLFSYYLKNNNCFIENKMIDENCIKLYDQYDDLNDRLKNVIENTVNITLKDLLEMSK